MLSRKPSLSSLVLLRRCDRKARPMQAGLVEGRGLCWEAQPAQAGSGGQGAHWGARLPAPWASSATCWHDLPCDLSVPQVPHF